MENTDRLTHGRTYCIFGRLYTQEELDLLLRAIFIFVYTATLTTNIIILLK